MSITSFAVPMMYGDHHVVAVRNLLLAQPGVTDVYASSCFRTVEIQYDEASVAVKELEEVLAAAGYLGEMSLPVETGAAAADPDNDPAFFRHSRVLVPAGDSVSFTQQVPSSGRPLWPCPGVKITSSDQ